MPFIIRALGQHNFTDACILFIAAAVTDAFDGAVARWSGNQTIIGSILDPIADKILLLSCFCAFAYMHSPVFKIPEWFVMLVLCKEATLIAGFAFQYTFLGLSDIRPSLLGKSTTLIQIMFVVWLFACYFTGYHNVLVYQLLIVVMAVLNVGSLAHYGFASWMNLKIKGLI